MLRQSTKPATGQAPLNSKLSSVMLSNGIINCCAASRTDKAVICSRLQGFVVESQALSPLLSKIEQLQAYPQIDLRHQQLLTASPL